MSKRKWSTRGVATSIEEHTVVKTEQQIEVELSTQICNTRDVATFPEEHTDVKTEQQNEQLIEVEMSTSIDVKTEQQDEPQSTPQLSGAVTIAQLTEWAADRSGLGLIERLQQFGAIPANGTLLCPRNGHRMRLVHDYRGGTWMCNQLYGREAKVKPRKCNTKCSIRSATYFESSRLLNLLTVCKVAHYLLVAGSSAAEMMAAIDEVEYLGTIHDAVRHCRRVLVDVMLTDVPLTTPIGGTGCTVELSIEPRWTTERHTTDSTTRADAWQLGALVRETGDCWLVTLPQCSATEVLGIVHECVRHGSVLLTARRPIFRQLGETASGYVHRYDSDERVGAGEELRRRVAALLHGKTPARASFYAGWLAEYLLRQQCAIRQQDPFVVFMTRAGRLFDDRRQAAKTKVVNSNADQ